MPLVQVHYVDSGVEDENYLAILDMTRELPNIVSRALHVEEEKEAHLKPTDIEVEMVPHAKVRINSKDVAIRIEAMDFRGRVAKIKASSTQIHDAARNWLPTKLSLSVWLVLTKANYVESQYAHTP